MTEKDVAELEEVGAIAISHTAVISALFSVLKAKGLLTGDDVNEVYNLAQNSLEVAEPDSPKVIRRARRVLDNTARNLSSGPA